jgi:hypothetical protein
LSNKNFDVTFIVEEEMSIINNSIIQIKHSFYEITPIFFLLIQFLNIRLLKLHYQNILANPNLFASHIFCLNETRIQNISS